MSASEVDILIVGGGIVGSAIAYHLAELGHADVLVIERGRFDDPPGSSGHAPGIIGRNAASPVVASLADYTSSLFAAIPVDAPSLDRAGSIEVVHEKEKLVLLRRKAEAARANGFRAEMLSRGEIGALVPYMDAEKCAGGLWIIDDGVLDAKRALRGLREAAAQRGVKFHESVEAKGFVTENGRVRGVETCGGALMASRTVLAAGIWGGMLLASAGLPAPLYTLQHPYLTTQTLDSLMGGEANRLRPVVRDLDNMFYVRKQNDRLGYGWFNHAAAITKVGDLTRAEIPFPEEFLEEAGSDLFPVLDTAPVETRLNGLLSMTPDGGPLLGELRGAAGLWVAEAVWFTHAGGVGRAIAEQMLGQTPTFDISSFDLGRFCGASETANRQGAMARYNGIYDWPV